MRRVFSTMLATLLGAASASARSSFTDVTPSNIAGLPRSTDVRCEALEEDLRFQVCVSDAEGDSLTQYTADMVVWRKNVKPRSSAVHEPRSRQESAAICRVEGVARNNARCYEVYVHRDMLHRVTLRLTFFPRGFPSCAEYEIMLSEFAGSRGEK